MAEATSALTFNDLILEVAVFLGLAYYGANGDEAAQIPVDAHDLALCQRHVNNGIRMFMADSPKGGWKWAKPTASVTIWGTIAVNTSNTASGGAYDSTNDQTTITIQSDAFYESMEGKTIVFTTTGSFTIKSYTSATVVVVSGDASAVSAETWSITADGNYTLPATFGGQYAGQIQYTQDTNKGVSPEWSTEANIRAWRENITDETGDPYLFAIRPMTTVFDSRRRWELMAYPRPDDVLVVEFPYFLYFDKLIATTEVQPAPIWHDDTIRAAGLAVAERDTDDTATQHHMAYYGKMLAKSHEIDSRTVPRKLGYFGNPDPPSGSPIRVFRDYLYQRPVVTYAQ